MIDFFSLVLALALPWILGIATIAASRRGNDALPAAWLVGCGWFVGMFVLTLVMRALSASGIRLSVASIAVPLALATALMLWISARGGPARVRDGVRSTLRAFAGHGLTGWQRTLWCVIVAWLAIRFALLFAEIWWRPLFAWDAWTQWSTKARVWFELGKLVPFVDHGAWVEAGRPDAYFDHGPHYPATVPLLQVWAALAVGQWDDALVNVPWLATGVALAIALHGGLRQLGFAPLIALGGSALATSLPILNVHIALGGYADLHMAAYVTLGALATVHAVRTRRLADAGLAVLLLVACVTIKNPGKAWLVAIMPGLIVAAMPRAGVKVVGLGFAAFALAILVLARTQIRILGYQLLPQFMMPWSALFDAWFSFANWNLLWYLALATAVLGWRQLLSREVAPFTCIVAAGLMFLFVGFAFTNAFLWVEDQSTVNRATLHLAPLVVVWMLVTLRAWRAARVPEPTLAVRPG